MRKHAVLLAGLVWVLGLGITSRIFDASPQQAQVSEIAKEAFSTLAGENYAALFARFDETMKSGLPVEKLQSVWKTVTLQAGAFKSQGAIRQEKAGSYNVIVVTCQFERMPLDIQLSFDAKQQIAGLYFRPAAAGNWP